MEPRACNSEGHLLICQLHCLPVHHTTNPLGPLTLPDPQTQDWKMKPGNNIRRWGSFLMTDSEHPESVVSGANYSRPAGYISHT